MRVLIPILAVCLSACATATADYASIGQARADGSYSEYGYIDRERGAGRVEVEAVAPNSRAAKAMAMRRAADLAQDAGRTHILIVDEWAEDQSGRFAKTRPRPTVEVEPDGTIAMEAGVGVAATSNLFHRGRHVHGLLIRFRDRSEPGAVAVQRILDGVGGGED